MVSSVDLYTLVLLTLFKDLSTMKKFLVLLAFLFATIPCVHSKEILRWVQESQQGGVQVVRLFDDVCTDKDVLDHVDAIGMPKEYKDQLKVLEADFAGTKDKGCYVFVGDVLFVVTPMYVGPTNITKDDFKDPK